MIPGSHAGKPPVDFLTGASTAVVDGAGLGDGSGVSSRQLSTPSPMVTATHNQNSSAPFYATSIDGLPSYSQILSSEDSVAEKVKAIYHGTSTRLHYQFTSVRPWTEFFDRSFFAAPQGVSDVVNRLNKNITYFYSNYLLVSLACSSYVLLINPVFSLCVAGLVFLYFYVRSRSAAMAEDENSDGMIYLLNCGFSPAQLYVMMLVFGLLMFYFTSGSSVIFWLALTSLGVTASHAAMRRPPLEDNSAFQLA